MAAAGGAPLTTADFDYVLPPECIAQVPAEPRDSARLMVVDRASQTVTHATFRDLPDFLPPATRLFRNDVAVLRARLRGRLDSGGAVECLLLEPAAVPGTWKALLRPGRKLPVGRRFALPGGAHAEVVSKPASGPATVRLELPAQTDLIAYTEGFGEVPLPPYIKPAGDATEQARRYNTVYADPQHRTAVAAPTAGLHYTPALLDRLAAAGHPSYTVTLRVGLGTFQPLPDGPLSSHQLHREAYAVPAATATAVRDRAGGPRLAIGTTTLRALEHFLRSFPDDAAGGGAEADLFLYPPARIGAADLLQTNFHLPRSSLLCLVSAFLTPGSRDGLPWLLELYREAISRQYRFYSYGDTMLIR